MPAYKLSNGPTQQSGFNLIELVIGIVVLSIALVIILNLIVPQARRSIDPIFQVRAAELAESMLNEITGKAFDEQSNKAGGQLRCGEAVSNPCTDPEDLGRDIDPSGDFETRSQFDDVDDYHNLNIIAKSQGPDLTALYNGFSVAVRVFYDGDLDGVDDGVVSNSKLIEVIITTPNDDSLRFTSFRSNY
ncbi:prepilin-type N-terminal cleavage/methylation domain-containing protein [Alteromonadaceae bacterium BrNp21-10]|nr:prepilin-type N-terminal cleavage/methylation domain-containing protein [Alteromonadaceae bacterium BrNp21-10]